jgi:RNA polymerase sigma-70 factor (ECF subfamily)
MSAPADFATLCRRLKASDREAFERVFRTLHDAVFRYIRSLTTTSAVAADITQDVFVSLWDARDRLDPSRSLEAYVYRMARNRVYNHQRDERTHTDKRAQMHAVAAPDAQRAPLPDAALHADVLESNINAWIEALPERQREAFVLSRFNGLSHDEVAAVMDVSPRTVNNHIVSALKTLRARIRAYEPSLLNR